MPDSSGDLDVLSEDPLCTAVYLPNLDVPIVPNERHCIRSHCPAPQISISDWSLPVTGDVNNPLDLSYDNRSWREAKLEASSGGHSWQHWEIDWEAANLGHTLLRSRATDVRGNVQPMLATWNFHGYQVDSIHSVPITVRKT